MDFFIITFFDSVFVQDGTEVVHDSPANKTSERHVYYCVPIPGENEWVKMVRSCLLLPLLSFGVDIFGAVLIAKVVGSYRISSPNNSSILICYI